MANEEKNSNEQAKEQQDQNKPEQGAQSAASSAGSVDLVANVDTAYATGETDANGDDVTGYALGGSHFKTSEEDAEELVAANKAFFAKEGENGSFVVDEEKTQKFQDEAAQSQDQAVSEASQAFTEDQPAKWLNSAGGMLGRDANESNNMPADAEELTGRYVDAGNANREQELHENSGVSVDQAGRKIPQRSE